MSFDTTIVAAIITAIATLLATALSIRGRTPGGRRRVTQEAEWPGDSSPASRIVYYQGTAHRLLRFGGRNSRIEALDGSPSFLGPTHEIFHDSEQTIRITRDSIAYRAQIQ
jgi:hypothetical protein